MSMLSLYWPVLGWQLTTADNREKLRQALLPVKDHSDNNVFIRLLRASAVEANPSEIRRNRKLVRDVTARRLSAQNRYDKCIEACQQIEAAKSQARPDQMEYVQREFDKRISERQSAQDELQALRVRENDLESELADAEAAFAQDEVLDFIKEKKYALHPFNLANAIAGLPFARDVNFIGVWVSRERSAKIESDHWPNLRYEVFKKIETIWNQKGTSNSSTVDFFRGKIAALPKKVKPTIPQQRWNKKKKRVPNLVRQQLADNFFYLEQAIDKSSKVAGTDPRPMPFLIAEGFDDLCAKPKTALDQVLAEAKKIP